MEKRAKIMKKIREIWNGAKGKNVELEKRLKLRSWTQKSALIQQRTSLGKCLKNVYAKGPPWL